MKSLETTIIAWVLSMMVAMPALASNTSVPPGVASAQFTEANIQSLFEQQDADSMQSFSIVELTDDDAQALFEEGAEPMELAMLSPEEMAATEGEWFFAAARATARYVPRAWRYVRTIRVRGHYDKKPHRFSNAWGPLRGNRPHIQMTIYRKGVKNSDFNVRVPAGRRTSWGSHRR
uniref:Uncharacterized protein n=1 Tax=Candidatus Kentrum sp. LFY TaxID=2126342 RepID=A0A450ULZ0_9GAMM|nr:MAG: hypothetical protein BECKLFY1418B_GA0070995_104715 [Candidatus Kentron sp. LFY]